MLFYKMSIFYEALTKANQLMNLTSITDAEEAEQKHFIDSLKALPFLYGEVLDIGAGAGFPSVPLAICMPDVSFTLVDSVGKKLDFIESVKELLRLHNIKTVKSRAEDLPKTKRYDCVLARGVAPLNILCEYCLPFIKQGGLLIAYKAQKAEEEVKAAQNALKILGGMVEKIMAYQLAVQEEKHGRNLILIQKIKECSGLYPRSGNKPRLKPL